MNNSEKKINKLVNKESSEAQEIVTDDNYTPWTGQVHGGKLNFRSTPTMENPQNIVTVLPTSSVVTVLGESGDFYKVDVEDVGAGYVLKKWIERL